MEEAGIDLSGVSMVYWGLTSGELLLHLPGVDSKVKTLFERIQEDRGEPFRPRPLSMAFDRDSQALERLARVAVILRTHYIPGRGWRFRAHEGSLTFHHRARQMFVKLFIDVENELAAKSGVGVHRDPVVVGVELTFEPPFARDALRDRLAMLESAHYVDPRAPREDTLNIIRNDKYWIAPHNDHFYDILFVARDGLVCPVDADDVKEYKRRIVASCSSS